VDRLFIDANVMFSAAYRDGAGVARLWGLGRATLVTSPYAVEEARRNLSHPEQFARLDRLTRQMDSVSEVNRDAVRSLGIELRDKDVPILGGAIAARASHLITGDKRDFGAFFNQVIGGVRVLTPAAHLSAHMSE